MQDCARYSSSLRFKEIKNMRIPPSTQSSPELGDHLHLEILERARNLISDRERWHRDSLAADRDGAPVPWADPLAAKWCATGALYRCALDVTGCVETAEHIGVEIASSIYPGHCALLSLQGLNDGAGQLFVLALFDRALRRREKHSVSSGATWPSCPRAA